MACDPPVRLVERREGSQMAACSWWESWSKYAMWLRLNTCADESHV
jgi:hypothetical protein